MALHQAMGSSTALCSVAAGSQPPTRLQRRFTPQGQVVGFGGPAVEDPPPRRQCPRLAATRSRAMSTAAAASRNRRCRRLEGLAAFSVHHGAIAATTAGSTGCSRCGRGRSAWTHADATPRRAASPAAGRGAGLGRAAGRDGGCRGEPSRDNVENRPPRTDHVTRDRVTHRGHGSFGRIRAIPAPGVGGARRSGDRRDRQDRLRRRRRGITGTAG